MQRLVKGATKPKIAAPKAKYIEPLLESTFKAQEFEQVMDALSRCLGRSPAWTTSYKALIVLHIMIREGQQDATLRFLSRHPRMLELDDDVARQAAGLGRYARYIGTRASQFKDTKVDFVRFRSKGKSRLYQLSVDKGLLRECESVIVQIDALIKCHFDERDVDNDVTLMAFHLLVHDLLSLFQVLNEGVINLLEHFFELSRYDAEIALEVYKGFTRLTSKVIAFLKVAKNLEYRTKLHVPNIKHAPTSLVSSLEVYLNDPDFDINRRQYLAEKQAHKSSKAELGARDSKRDLQEPRQDEGLRELQEQLQRQQAELQQQQLVYEQMQHQAQPQAQNAQRQMSQYQPQPQPQAQAQPPAQAGFYPGPQPQGPQGQQASQQSIYQQQPQSQPQQPQQQQPAPLVDLLTGDPFYNTNAQQIQQQQQQMQQQQMQQAELQRQQSFNFYPQAQAPQAQPILSGQHTGLTGQPTGPVQQAAQAAQPTGYNPFKRVSSQSMQPPTQHTQAPPMPSVPVAHTGQYQPLQAQYTPGGAQLQPQYTQTSPVNPFRQSQAPPQPQQPSHTGGFNFHQPQATGRNPFRTSIQ